MDNPLFDKWLEAVTPYYQREKQQYLSYGWGFDMPWDVRNADLDTQVAVERAMNEADPLPDERVPGDVALISPFKARTELVFTHAWAVPSERAIDAIVKHSPAGVVEIGAGTGYWARLLRERGLLVMAYDEMPHENDQTRGKWSPVEVGGPEKAALWPQLALFLCWPPYDTPMARMCLNAYAGSTLLYIGEGSGGCTGDEEFHQEIENHWTELEYVGLPQWPGIHDGLYVYQRTV